MKSLSDKLSIVVFVLCWVLLGKVAQANSEYSQAITSVSVDELDLFDKARQRPVKATVWYRGNADCNSARICLADEVNTKQVAVLSHGAMGAAKNYNWIGYALASQGIVVIGVNHFGESWVYGPENIDPSVALRFELRPQDVSFVLDQLSHETPMQRVFDKELAWNNVTAIGHSSGGATALALAGGQFELVKALEYCRSGMAKQDKSCAYMQHLKADELPHAQVSFKDNRIQRIVAMDPALGHVTNTNSLAKMAVPVLLIGSKQNDFLVYEQHAGKYAKFIPAAQNVVLDNGEGHFIYLDECQHQYKAMGVSLCEDREGVDRQATHRQTYPHLFNFIYTS